MVEEQPRGDKREYRGLMSPEMERNKLRFDGSEGTMAMIAGLEDVGNLFRTKERRQELREDEMVKLNETGFFLVKERSEVPSGTRILYSTWVDT